MKKTVQVRKFKGQLVLCDPDGKMLPQQQSLCYEEVLEPGTQRIYAHYVTVRFIVTPDVFDVSEVDGPEDLTG